MRVVVTGAAGFIGRRLVARLAGQGIEVVAADRVAPPEPAPGVRHVVCDLESVGWAGIAEGFGKGPFSLVHLAWVPPRAAADEQDRQAALLPALMDDARKAGLAQVVALGSASEYGCRDGCLGEEDSPVEPLTPYGRAKRRALADALAAAQRQGVGLKWLRPFIVYGPGQSGDQVIPYAVRQALRKQPALFTDGHQLRDFVHVDDVVEAMVLALASPPPSSFVVNLGCGEAVAVRDVLDELGRLLGAGGLFRVGALPQRPGEPDMQVADLRRAGRLLGWAPSIQWREGLKSLCPSQARHP